MRTVDEKIIVALHEIRDAIGGGGSSSSSKETTIDDVVKFIHDNAAAGFPYTTWDEIPIWTGNQDEGFYRKGSVAIPIANRTFVLNLPSDYIMFYYESDDPTIN